MPVMNTKGELFDERRKKQRRVEDKTVAVDNRKSDRRKKDINAKPKKK